MKILIVEDQKKIADTISEKLKREGFAVDCAGDGVTGEELAQINDYDAIILDILIPKQDGWDTCRNLRDADVLTPILMLTALEETADKIKGLNEGADDYLAKPFHLEELVARIRSLIRRNTIVRSSSIELYGLYLNLDQQKAFRDGKEIVLTAKEFALLELFMHHPKRILNREFISEHLWDMNFDPKSNVIESFIKFLRKKIDKDFDVQLIHTVRGSGYIFSDSQR
jgi:DNA-binding response OmpR family regulator